MKIFPRSFSDSIPAGGKRSELFEDARESFTDSFAYDHFQWPDFEIFGSARPSIVEFRTPAERAAEERGMEGGSGDGEAGVRAYTTTNSDIPIYKSGVVVAADPVGTVSPQTAQSSPLIDLDEFRADARFDHIDGSGYAVVIIDTGIDLDDPFFGADANGDGISDRIVYQYDFADNDANASDFDGHGSNVASIAISSDGTYTGMAPGADIVALKVFSDFSDSGSFGDVEASLQWVIANATAYNIVSVNMSLGDSGNYNTPIGLYGIADELATLAAMDVIVVSSSGNSFYELNSVQGVSYPSADPNSLSVGAVYDGNTGGWIYEDGATAYTTGADRITPFSQRDDQLTDIFAPGAVITGAGAGNELVSIHGTSQAAPHIAGIVALAQQLAAEVLGRRLTYDEFSDLLTASADIIIDGDDEHDNVANTGLAFPRVNMAKLGEAIVDLAEPNGFSIEVLAASRAEGNGGSTAFTFTVTRSGYSGESASVGYSITGGSADVADFTGNTLPSGTVTFAAGETSKTLTILVKGDTLFEGNETFTVSLSDPSGGGTIDAGSAAGLIVNDDAAPTVSSFAIAAADSVKLEGDAGSTDFTFTVTRGGNSSGTVSVDYSLSGTADAADFTGGQLPAGRLTFGPGETSKTITISVAGDSQFENDEGFTVTLSNPSTGTSIETATANGIIVNDDAPPPAPLVLLAADFDTPGDTEGFAYSDGLFGGLPSQRYASGAWEDQALTVDLGGVNNNFARDISGGWETSFSLDEAAEVTLSFLYELDTGNDYEPNEYTQMLVRIDGGTPILVDALTGNGNGGPDLTTGPQSFSALLGTLSAGSHTLAIGGYNNQKTWNLEQSSLVIDDVLVTVAPDGDVTPPNPPVFSIAALDAVKTEGDAGATAFSFTVTRGGDSTAAVSVDYGVSGGADAADFVGGLPAGTLSFAAGEVSKTLTLQVAGDTNGEGDEGFTVALTNPSAGAAVDTASAQGTILNDDAAVPLTFITVTGAGAVKPEGDSGTADFEFRLSRSGDLTSAETVNFTVTGGDVDGADFTAGSLPVGSVFFAPGQSIAYAVIDVAGDTDFEPNETFSVSFAATAPNTHITTPEISGTIQNDDPTPATSFFAIATADSSKLEGHAGSTPFTFRVTRSGDLDEPGWVDYSVTPGSGNAADAADFAGGALPSGRVYFAAGEALTLLTIDVAADTDYEPHESFVVTLTGSSPDSAITQVSANGYIANDEPPPVTTFYAIAAQDAVQSEGDAGETLFTFTVTRSGDTSQSGTVHYSLAGAGGDAADGNDFADGLFGLTALTFGAGEDSKTVSIRVAGDTDFESDEGFAVTLANPSTGGAITTAAAQGTILNDDTSGRGTTYFFASAYDADKPEGTGDTTAFTFLVTRSGDTTAADTIDYMVTGSGANPASAGDFAGGVLPSGSITFAVGETARFVTIQVAADAAVEPEEIFTLTIANPPPNGQIQKPSDDATIGNDDFPAEGPFVIIDADFDGSFSGTENFDYVEGVFGGTTDPSLTRGNWTAADITVVLGGGGSTQATMTGGWERSFTLDQEMELSLSFLYDIFHSRQFEADEYTQVLVSIDGGAPIVIDQITGDAGSTADYIVPPTTAQLDLGTFGPGSHSIVIGGLLNKMDGPDEYNTIGIDDVLLIGSLPAPTPPSFAIAGLNAVQDEGDSGVTAFTFTVNRSGDLSAAGSVDYNVVPPGTPDFATGSDFAGNLWPAGSLSFAAGEASKTLTFEVAGDIDVEADEVFAVQLSNASGGSSITTNEAFGTILNDDTTPVSYISIAAQITDLAETDANPIGHGFLVTRSGDLSGTVTVDYAVTGGDANADDFQGGVLPSGTVSFAPGQSIKAIDIIVDGDYDYEPDESFIVSLSNPTGNGEITNGSAESLILNDDQEPGTTFYAIAAAEAVKAEGDSGDTYFTFTVTRSGDLSFNSAVHYSLSGNGANPADGDDFSTGLIQSGAIAFSDTQTSADITIRVSGDSTFEPDEDFIVSIFDASAEGVILTASATGTILNDDPAPPSTFYEIAALDAAKEESNFAAPAFTFTVTRSGDTSAAGSVDYVVSGDVDASDFLGGLPAGTLTFAAGEVSQTLTLLVSGDTTLEGDEDFTVTLSNASAGSEISVASANGTILNDDPTTFFAIAAVDAAKAEGHSGTTPFTFVVTRSGDTSGAGSVDYTVADLPAPIFSYPVDGDDFAGGVLPSGTINFAAGETSKTITIDVAGDHSLENTESFMVALSNASPGSAITTSSATGVIENDDLGGGPISDVAISADIAVQAEGDAGSKGFTFTVTRSGYTAEAASVDWAVSGSEIDGADFVGGSLPGGTVSFAAGEVSKTITVEVAGDTDFEADESFTVTLSNPSDYTTITTGSAEGTILNDDAAPPTTFLAIAAEDAVRSEGLINETFLTFIVTRSGDTSAAGSVDYAVAGAVDGDDFVGGLLPAGTLSFAAGEVSKTLSFNVAGDGLEEPDEDFTVTLSNASAGAAITAATAEGTILNDDVPPPPVDTYLTLSAADAVKSEGDGGSTIFSFLVSRSGTPIDDTSVDYTVVGSGDNPADADDFVGGVLPSGSVAIQGEGASAAWIHIEVAGDLAEEADESFMVVLSNPSAGAAIATGSASGSILNDDTPETPDSVVLLQADFDAAGDTGGFTYVDAAFGGSFIQRYADGEWTDGALAVSLGGTNNRIATDVNGGWEADFTLAEAMDVTLSFDYALLISAGYEPDEYSQLLVSVDGGDAILVEELFGGGTLTSGAQSASLDLGELAAGSHSIVIGGYNNKKSWADEFTEISIDDVLVTGSAPASGAGAPGLPLGGSPLDLATSGLSESELLSTAGF